MGIRDDHDTGAVDAWLEELDVEEIWSTDCAARGIEALERYLAVQAAFQAYLESCERGSPLVERGADPG